MSRAAAGRSAAAAVAGTASSSVSSSASTSSSSSAAAVGANPNPNVAAAAAVDDDKIGEFLSKTYTMVADPANAHIVSFLDDDDGFVVKDEKEFTAKLFEYFRHSNFSSFVRQLNFYGFSKRSTKQGCNYFKRKYFNRAGDQLHLIKRKQSEASTSSGAAKLNPKQLQDQLNELKEQYSEILANQQRVAYILLTYLRGVGAINPQLQLQLQPSQPCQLTHQPFIAGQLEHLPPVNSNSNSKSSGSSGSRGRSRSSDEDSRAGDDPDDPDEANDDDPDGDDDSSTSSSASPPSSGPGGSVLGKRGDPYGRAGNSNQASTGTKRPRLLTDESGSSSSSSPSSSTYTGTTALAEYDYGLAAGQAQHHGYNPHNNPQQPHGTTAVVGLPGLPQLNLSWSDFAQLQAAIAGLPMAPEILGAGLSGPVPRPFGPAAGSTGSSSSSSSSSSSGSSSMPGSSSTSSGVPHLASLGNSFSSGGLGGYGSPSSSSALGQPQALVPPNLQYGHHHSGSHHHSSHHSSNPYYRAASVASTAVAPDPFGYLLTDGTSSGASGGSSGASSVGHTGGGIDVDTELIPGSPRYHHLRHAGIHNQNSHHHSGGGLAGGWDSMPNTPRSSGGSGGGSSSGLGGFGSGLGSGLGGVGIGMADDPLHSHHSSHVPSALPGAPSASAIIPAAVSALASSSAVLGAASGGPSAPGTAANTAAAGGVGMGVGGFVPAADGVFEVDTAWLSRRPGAAPSGTAAATAPAVVGGIPSGGGIPNPSAANGIDDEDDADFFVTPAAAAVSSGGVPRGAIVGSGAHALRSGTGGAGVGVTASPPLAGVPGLPGGVPGVVPVAPAALMEDDTASLQDLDVDRFLS